MARGVGIAPAAERRKLSKQSQSAIFECLTALRRVRVGDYRVIYSIRDKNLVVIIIRVAHRKEAYRQEQHEDRALSYKDSGNSENNLSSSSAI